jgi:hypothetical protein
MTVIVLAAAGEPDAEPDGVPVPVCEQAVATSRAAKATMATRRVDRAMAHTPSADVAARTAADPPDLFSRVAGRERG